jgi:hypothetical protein
MCLLRSSLIAVVALCSCVGVAHGERVVLPPFTEQVEDGVLVRFLRCERFGARMDCYMTGVAVQRLAIPPRVSAPDGHARKDGCFLHVSTQRIRFFRAKKGSWVGHVVVPYCRTKTTYTLSPLGSDSLPTGLRLRMSFSIGDKSPDCVKSFKDFGRQMPGYAKVMEWNKTKQVRFAKRCLWFWNVSPGVPNALFAR